MSDQEMRFFMFVLMTVLGGPALALAYRLPHSRRAFEKRKAMFAEGRLKRDPQTEMLGPHRSFLRNMLGGFVLFAVLSTAMTAGMRLTGN